MSYLSVLEHVCFLIHIPTLLIPTTAGLLRNIYIDATSTFLMHNAKGIYIDNMYADINILVGIISNNSPLDRGLAGPGTLLVSYSYLHQLYFFEKKNMRSSDLLIANLHILIYTIHQMFFSHKIGGILDTQLEFQFHNTFRFNASNFSLKPEMVIVQPYVGFPSCIL